MNFPRALAACLAAAALAAPAAPALANGGVIILLTADYHFHLRTGECDTLVIVAGDRAVDHVVERIESEGDIAAVRVARTRLKLKLTPVDEAHLTGEVLGRDQPVLVVSRTYAAEHHWRRHHRGARRDVAPCTPPPAATAD